MAKAHNWVVTIGRPGKTKQFTITVTLDDQAVAQALERHDEAPGHNRASEDAIVQGLTPLTVKGTSSFF